MLIFYSTFCKHFYCFIFIFIPVQACSSGIISNNKIFIKFSDFISQV